MTQMVQKALESLRPHRPHRLFPLCFVSEKTRVNAKQVLEYLEREDELSDSDLDQIKRLIDECSHVDTRNILNVVNWDGFTLLQHAVIGNHLAVIKLLLKKGCDVNAGICSLPLHLACRLGRARAARLLLTHNAHPQLECTVCYPQPHKMNTYPDQICCLAYQPAHTAVQHALRGDHERVLRVLLQHDCGVHTDYLLHDACRVGAHECSRFLLRQYSEQMCRRNGDGRTPLQVSMLTDTDSAIFLLNHGADFQSAVFLNAAGSMLHELYRTKTTPSVVKATQFALAHGFRAHINIRDAAGDTALNVLLRHVGRGVRGRTQASYDSEVQECIKLLLVHGANPNIVNVSGESALHAVLADSCARTLYVSRHGHVRRLKPLLQEICKVVEILLAHGADAGVRRMAAAATVPSLHYAIRIFQSLQPDMFVVVKQPMKQLLLLLSGCDVNTADSYGMTPVLLLFSAAYKWLSMSGGNTTFSRTIVPFLSDVLQHFLRRGLDANAPLRYFTKRAQEPVDSTYLKEVVIFLNLPRDAQFLESIRLLLLKLGQRGADTNRLCLTWCGSGVGSAALPRNADIVFLLARALRAQTPDTLPTMLNAVNFFVKTLTEPNLVVFLQALGRCMAAAWPTPSTQQDVIVKRLSRYAEAPRRLKELCRISIAKHVNWKLTTNCPKLPLPRAMLQYVVNLDA